MHEKITCVLWLFHYTKISWLFVIYVERKYRMENAGVNLIQFEHIKKVFDGDTLVVEDFNLEVKKGEFVTFLGPSGCGKTTILRMLGGFEIPTAGKILLNGEDISKLPP